MKYDIIEKYAQGFFFRVRPGCLGSIDIFTAEYVIPIETGQKCDASKRELANARKGSGISRFFYLEKFIINTDNSFIFGKNLCLLLKLYYDF